jgi:hypothetical protein
MFGLTALELAKIQFRFTISAHIIIPATTNLFAGQAIRRSHLDQIPRCPARGTPRRSKYVRWRAYAQHRACYGSFERFACVESGLSQTKGSQTKVCGAQTNTTFGSTSVGSSYSLYLI